MSYDENNSEELKDIDEMMDDLGIEDVEIDDSLELDEDFGQELID